MKMIHCFALVILIICCGANSMAHDKVVVIPLIEEAADKIPTVKSLTGRLWMDRNLGATRKAQSIDDSQAYGHLYQWGRPEDGHQRRNSSSTTAKSFEDIPGHALFIRGSSDWRSPSRDVLWQPLYGDHDPCPTGFRVPTKQEWIDEIGTWSYPPGGSLQAFQSALALPAAGWRHSGGSFYGEGSVMRYWTLDVNPDNPATAWAYITYPTHHYIDTPYRASGYSLRCIAE